LKICLKNKSSRIRFINSKSYVVKFTLRASLPARVDL